MSQASVTSAGKERGHDQGDFQAVEGSISGFWPLVTRMCT